MEPRLNHHQSVSDPEPVVTYFPDSQWLWVDSGKPLGEAETIANGVVVYYGKDDAGQAEGIRIEFAEAVLKPFVDAILAKYGVDRMQPLDAGRVNTPQADPNGVPAE